MVGLLGCCFFVPGGDWFRCMEIPLVIEFWGDIWVAIAFYRGGLISVCSYICMLIGKITSFGSRLIIYVFVDGFFPFFVLLACLIILE